MSGKNLIYNCYSGHGHPARHLRVATAGYGRQSNARHTASNFRLFWRIALVLIIRGRENMPTKESLRLFFSSCALTFVLIAGFCGFIMVDLSTDRYMPGDFEPIFLIERLDHTGLEFSAMGKSYRVDSATLLGAEENFFNLRGLLPGAFRLAGTAGQALAGIQEAA
jgi:hypothetical protein